MTDKYLNYIKYLIINYNGISGKNIEFDVNMIPMFEIGELLSLVMSKFLKCYNKKYNVIDVIKNINRYDSSKEILKIDKKMCKTLREYNII